MEKEPITTWEGKGTNNNLQLSVYRKPTHTGLYINWLSFVPFRYKLNLIKWLLDKAFKICSNRPLMQKELDFISTLLGKNGYPKRLIKIQTRKFLREKEKVVETTTRTKEQVKCVFFRLPYIGNVSNQIQKKNSTIYLQNKTLQVYHDSFNYNNWTKIPI